MIGLANNATTYVTNPTRDPAVGIITGTGQGGKSNQYVFHISYHLCLSLVLFNNRKHTGGGTTEKTYLSLQRQRDSLCKSWANTAG